jgi:hypothetical protein
MANKVSNNGFNKYCLNCNEYNIENKKQNCPKCKTKLPKLKELQKHNITEEINLSKNIKKSPNFKFYNVEDELQTQSTSRISITQ